MMQSFAALVFPVFGALDATIPDCFSGATCNTLENKDPALDQRMGPSVEFGLTDDARKEFEHALGIAFLDVPGVQEVWRELGSRLFRLVEQGGKEVLGLNKTTAVTRAFIEQAPKNSPGWLGPDPAKIEAALANGEGNFRSVGSIIYAFTKSSIMNDLFSGPSSFYISEFGTSAAEAIEARRQLVKASDQLEDKYGHGVPDFLFPSFDSWARFTFTLDGAWKGAREWRGDSCELDTTMSDDPSIQPPVIGDELEFVCNGSPRCHLNWEVGAGCFKTVDTPFDEGVPGFVERANRMGYRTVAGPSGTTANVLQLATLLGLSGDDLVMLRTALMAWMLPKDDHSLLEIVLAANPYMLPGSKIVMSERDLTWIWNHDMKTTWGDIFLAKDFWDIVAGELPTFESARLGLLRELPAMDEPIVLV